MNMYKYEYAGNGGAKHSLKSKTSTNFESLNAPCSVHNMGANPEEEYYIASE